MSNFYLAPYRRLARSFAPAIDNRRPTVHIPLDVTVEGDVYTLTGYIPGIDAEDLKIEVKEDMVAISGEFARQEESEEKRYLLRERVSGKFSRSLRLPTVLDAGKSEAEVKDGILTLRVSQADEAKAKQIKVKVAK